ncbi:NF-kappa-B inhibitor cactus-like isoform X2 [Neocloeon triangulifer]|uniref:NF-kappa-B inhibitor cactus-like isoform X2 n=1 Tax=Neocloeon triangulifer TaxID=2078957 RepID=UPI00286F427A|nr:NF-kappa-B inhibitor cactus-like isoform X2 [Neocloeon triangulifer]
MPSKSWKVCASRKHIDTVATKDWSSKCEDEDNLDSGLVASEQSLTSEQGLSGKRDSAFHESEENLLSSASSMRYDHQDSGLGLHEGLNDHFSGLSLKSHLNDLNAPPSPTSTTFTPSSPTGSCQKVPLSPQKEILPEPRNLGLDDLYFDQDEDGDTNLHIAIIQGFIEAVYSLIRMAPDPQYLDIPNNYHQTPLHLAVLTQQERIVRALLVAGASPNLRDRNGNTALHLASEQGFSKCVHALLQPITVEEMSTSGLVFNAPRYISKQVLLEEQNYDGQHCVHLAAAGDHADVLRRLVWAGANINARELKCGRTPLHIAAERSKRNVWEAILKDHNCSQLVDCSLETYSGYTAYQLALYADRSLAAELSKRGFASALPVDDESDSDDDMILGQQPVEGFFGGFNNFLTSSRPIMSA